MRSENGFSDSLQPDFDNLGAPPDMGERVPYIGEGAQHLIKPNAISTKVGATPNEKCPPQKPQSSATFLRP
jgi:hypothetical protein